VNSSVSTGHILAIVLTVAAVAVPVPLARLRPGRWSTAFGWTLAFLLVANELGYQVVQWRAAFDFYPWAVDRSLPLYICDIAALVGAVALVWRRPLLVEITWYWALAGTLQGIFTPDHAIGFPSYDWLEFYLDHIGVVLAACWLVLGLRIHPRPRAALRVAIITVLFIALVGVVDGLTGGDYDYLHASHPPGLLALLGPWPWYLFGATGIGLVSILVFDLPFWPERHRARRAAQAGLAGRDRPRPVSAGPVR